MSESTPTDLERAYRRLVACYPRSFRRDNEDEIVSVLLATAPDGQRRPGIAESADLIKGAVRMRMGLSRTPHTVLNAVRLMYLGAVAEVGALITFLLTEGSIRAAIYHRLPHLTAAQLAAVNSDVNRLFTIDIVGGLIAVVLWLWVAWATGKGSQFARLAAILCFALSTAAVIVDLASGSVRYAPISMIVGVVVWLIGFGAVVNLLRKQSWAYYERQAAGV
jgi:hypothetical protein